MDMFKALDIWMTELEEEFYENHMRAHKDMIRHKEALEAKIMKICDQIDSIMDEFGEYSIKGTNGKVATFGESTRVVGISSVLIPAFCVRR